MYQRYLELLEKAGETTAQVSRATGIAENVFSNWKQRNGKLSSENLLKLAKHFGVPMEYFLDQEEVTE